MPFEIYHEPFGVLAEYFIQNTATGEYISVIPAHGAILRRLVLRKGDKLNSLLKTPDSQQALAASETYASEFLFPFPSRLRHGIYTFEGEAYTLPLNDTKRNNAMHGFVAGQPFELAGQRITDTEATLTLIYRHDGSHQGYPFPFDFQVSYTLATGPESGLTVQYEVLNTGTKAAPVGFGWHPYFTLNGEPVDALTITIPAQRKIVLDDAMLPAGEELSGLTGEVSLHERNLDAAFIVDETPEAGVTTTLRSARQGLQLNLWQETGPGKFNYLVVFTPPGRDSIGIEPLTCNVDAFNNGEGLTVLQPGTTTVGTFRISLS